MNILRQARVFHNKHYDIIFVKLYPFCKSYSKKNKMEHGIHIILLLFIFWQFGGSLADSVHFTKLHSYLLTFTGD